MDKAQTQSACTIALVNPLAIAYLEPPGRWGKNEEGVDIVCGEAQSLGVPLSFGGPYLGFLACKKKHVRQIPGRIVGKSKDRHHNTAYCLTLQAREQHIRRDKATSNICTNSGLCTLAFTIHMTLLGEAGLRKLALLNHEAACRTADALAKIDGVELLNKSYFNEFTLRLSKDASEVVEKLAEGGVLAGVPGARLLPHRKDARNLLIVAATECVTDEDIEMFSSKLSEALS